MQPVKAGKKGSAVPGCVNLLNCWVVNSGEKTMDEGMVTAKLRHITVGGISHQTLSLKTPSN
jgi:hypothetical protein